MSSQKIFQYGATEINYLKEKDDAMAAAINLIGPIERRVTGDLFSSLVNSIVSQQISTSAAVTVWNRLTEKLAVITPKSVTQARLEEIQTCGMSMRKAIYIKDTAEQIHSGTFDLEVLHTLPDLEVCARLSALKGIGVWTAEMLMTFSMQRPDIFSFGDLAIHRGLRMLYHHRVVSRQMFEKYRRRYTPYGSVASLYLWAIASGQYGYRDYAPKTPTKKKSFK